MAAGTALTLALGSLIIYLFEWPIPGVLHEALGFMSLAFGVLGCVKSEATGARLSSAFGLLLGVGVVPTVTAINIGLGNPVAVGLLTSGALASVFALIGAQMLRQGTIAVVKARS